MSEFSPGELAEAGQKPKLSPKAHAIMGAIMRSLGVSVASVSA